MKKIILLICFMTVVFAGCGESSDFAGEFLEPHLETESPNAVMPSEEMASVEPTVTASSDEEVVSPQVSCCVPGGVEGLAPDDFIRAEDEAYWYYWNENGMYRLDKENYISQRIGDQWIKGASFGWLYFIRECEEYEKYEICRMDSSGENIVCLFEETQIYPASIDLYVGERYLVYHDGAYEGYFYCYDLETAEITKLTVHTFYPEVVLSEDKLYTMRADTISVTDLKTKKTEVCLTTEYPRTIITFRVIGGDIYCREGDPHSIYRYSEGERTLIFMEPDEEDEVLGSYSLHTYADKLYFLLRDYRDGQNRSVIYSYDPSVDQIRECVSIDPTIKPYIDHNRLIYMDEDGISHCAMIA